MQMRLLLGDYLAYCRLKQLGCFICHPEVYHIALGMPQTSIRIPTPVAVNELRGNSISRLSKDEVVLSCIIRSNLSYEKQKSDE